MFGLSLYDMEWIWVLQGKSWSSAASLCVAECICTLCFSVCRPSFKDCAMVRRVVVGSYFV